MQMLTPAPTPAINANASQYILTAITLPSLTPGQISSTHTGLLMDGSREGLAIIQTSADKWAIYHVASGAMLINAHVRSMTALITAIGRTFNYGGNWQAAAVTDLNAAAFRSLANLHGYLG